MLSSVDGEGTTHGSTFIELLPRIAVNKTRSLMLGIYRFTAKAEAWTTDKEGRAGFCAHPTSASAPESALGSRPRVVLPSAQANIHITQNSQSFQTQEPHKPKP
jgi:hypothetical protein